MKKLLTATILAISLPACAESTRADTAEPQVALPEVGDLMSAHDAAWNAHDPDQLTSLFAADGTLVTPTGKRVEGRDALREIFASPGPTKQTSSSTEVLAVQRVADDIVVIDAEQTLSGPGVEMLPGNRARVVIVARAEQGKWQIVSARPYVPVTPGK